MSMVCTCTIYRVYPEPDQTIEFADTIPLTLTQSEDDKYLLPDLNITLGENLEKYEISGIFLDSACTNTIEPGDDITNSIEITGTMDNMSFGNMSLYVKLVSKAIYTVTWLYGASSELSITTEVVSGATPSQPIINNSFIENTDAGLKCYTFDAWEPAIDESTVITENCSFTAKYTEKSYESEIPYTANFVNMLSNAEPYYFGNPFPPSNIFKPLPTSDNPLTPNINEQMYFQEGQNNGFSENEIIPGYRHNNNILSYVKKGTFPKAGKNQQLFLGGVLSSSGNNATLWDDTKVFKLWLDKNTNKLEYENNGTRGTCSAEFLGLPFMPTKFGILLVGAGGGSGGFTWYDPDKNGKKSDQYIVSGSGGGGGGLIWGVIDLENTDAVNYYLIKTGKSGTAGTNATRNGLKKKKPKYGGDGTAGTATELYWHPNGSKGDGSLLAVAGGGKGGARGNFQTYAAGGDGGTNSYSAHNRFVYCGSKNGGNGCSCYTEPLPKIDAWSVSIKFAQTDNTNYITTISHGEVSAVVQGGTDKDARAHKVPGGHSYYPGNISVNGAGGGTNGEDYILAYGRGGAGGDWSDISESGAPGCFILFY